jgi:pyrroline-5-carboxylate reductase
MRTVAIGVGNMGAALVRGLVEREVVQRSELTLVDRDEARAMSLAESIGCHAGPLAPAELYLLAVKPQGMAQALAEMAPHVEDSAVVMSVAAGVTLAQLRRALPAGHLVRAMPNTPALVGRGASAFALEAGAPSSVGELAQRVLSAVGVAVEVDERHMDAVTAVSGSGPAYVFAFLEALTEAAEAVGLPPEVAGLLARQTVIGAGHMLEARPESAQQLRQAVTSPGGTTAAALEVLTGTGALGELVTLAVARARARGEELAALVGGG